MNEMVETGKMLIRTSEINKDFKYEISKMPSGEKLLYCLQCGTCTSDCPIARFSENYGIPVLHYPQLLGLAIGLLPEELAFNGLRVNSSKVLEQVQKGIT